jgi:hypothetical protein
MSAASLTPSSTSPDTSRLPHADPNEIGRAFNQALICDPTVAGADLSVAGPSSDDITTRRDGRAATLDDVIEFYDRGGDPEGTYLGGPKRSIRSIYRLCRNFS